MFEVSDKLAAYLKETGRHFKSKIKVGDTTISDVIDEMTLFSVLSSEKMTIGNVNSSYVEVKLFNCPDNISGCEIEVSVSAEIDGADEDIRLGYFTAEKPKTVDGLTTFTAYDRVKSKTAGTYQTELSGDTPIDTVFEEVCSQCGVECVPLYSAETAQEDKLTVNPLQLNGKTKIAVLGQISGLFGGNLVCNRDGKFEVRKYSICDAEYDDDMCDLPEVSEDVFNLQRLTCYCGEKTLTAGSGDGITFENDLMTQERLESLLNELKGMTYTPLSCEILVGDPRIEVGDIVTLTVGGKTYSVPVMQCEISFDGGIISTIKSFSQTENEESTQRAESVSEKVRQASDYAKAAGEAHNSFLKTLKDGLDKGLYQTKVEKADGSSVIYYHDTPDIENATYIQTFNAGGRGWTSGTGCWNGGSPNFKYGETKDGDAILRDLLVRTLTADLIRAGKLSSFDGNTYFDLDNSEILTTGQSDAFSYVGTINAGRAVFAKSETDADTGESTVLSESILGNSGLSMQTVEPEDYVFKTPDTITVNGEEIAWSEATDVQKALYKLTDLVNYLANSAYGINILTKGKDGNNYSAHFDGMKLLLRQGYIEAKTVTAESLLFKYNENDILMSEFVDNIVVGLTVEANSDMNNITGIGRYNIEANTVAETCSNLPIVANGKAVAGYLEVFALGKTGYILQRFTPYNNEGIFTRWYNQYNSSWGSWMKYSATSVSTYTP